MPPSKRICVGKYLHALQEDINICISYIYQIRAFSPFPFPFPFPFPAPCTEHKHLKFDLFADLFGSVYFL